MNIERLRARLSRVALLSALGATINDVSVSRILSWGEWPGPEDPRVEFLQAYSVHVGDRLADPRVHCLQSDRQLQPAQCSIVSRKFRRAGSGITGQVSRCEGLGWGTGHSVSSTRLHRLVMPVFWTEC